MPEADGFDIAQYINTEKTYVVFVTAYNQYALRAFRANATDYILKPIDISILKETVERIKKNIEQNHFPDVNDIITKIYKSPKISISSMEGIEYIDLEDIILIAADKSYSIFHLPDRTIISSKNLKHYSEKIKDPAFYRPHNSYLVNLNHVKRYEYKDGAKIEMSNGMKIPISRSKRNEFLETIQKYFEE
jgi:two-component system LytT family response regulator